MIGYVEKVVDAILKDEIDKNIIMEKFMQKFENASKDMDNDERWKAACRIVSKKMVRGFEKKMCWRVSENHQNY